MSSRVLVLGATAEGRRLAEALTAEGVEVLSSLAGRTADPVLPPGDVRIGGFGGAEGLADWLRADRGRAGVDATHPFAAAITQHAVQAARAPRTPPLRLQPPGWRGEGRGGRGRGGPPGCGGRAGGSRPATTGAGSTRWRRRPRRSPASRTSS